MKKFLLLLPFLVIFFVSAHAQMADVDDFYADSIVTQNNAIVSTSHDQQISASAFKISSAGSFNFFGLSVKKTTAGIIALSILLVVFFLFWSFMVVAFKGLIAHAKETGESFFSWRSPLKK